MPDLPPSAGGLLIAAIDGQSDRVQSLTLGDTYLISSNMVNNVRATANRSDNVTDQNSTVDLADLFAAAGVPSVRDQSSINWARRSFRSTCLVST